MIKKSTIKSQIYKTINEKKIRYQTSLLRDEKSKLQYFKPLASAVGTDNL